MNKYHTVVVENFHEKVVLRKYLITLFINFEFHIFDRDLNEHLCTCMM